MIDRVDRHELDAGLLVNIGEGELLEEARGGVVYEQTPVTQFKPGSLITPGGELRAKRAIVLAGEVYMTRFPRLHRSLLPAYSLISLTEPLTPAQWSQVGWQGGESVSSTRNTVVYLTKTADGRILFGSRGAPYVFGSKITDGQDIHEATVKMIQGSLLEWFPQLEGIRFTHAWGGPVAMPRDWMPAVRFDAESRTGSIMGYTLAIGRPAWRRCRLRNDVHLTGRWSHCGGWWCGICSALFCASMRRRRRVVRGRWMQGSPNSWGATRVVRR